MPSKEWNISFWGNDHPWESDGDEFHQFATDCGQVYNEWKNGLVTELLLPYVSTESSVLEIGCGHGRWSSLLAGNVSRLYLTDIATSCIDFCRSRFGDNGIEYIVSDGNLSLIPMASIDFVWCFDVMMHVEPEDINVYVKEISRVLKVG